MRAASPSDHLGLPARLVRLAAALVAGVVLAACSNGDGEDGSDRRAEMYGVVLDWILEREQFPAPDGEPSDDTPTVFVDHLTRAIDFDVQVALVGRFEDRYELRFVDSLTEAVDEKEPEGPVRNRGVLVGLGAIPDSGPYLVRAEVYRQRQDIDAYRFELIRTGPDWVLRNEPEPVEPEGFVPGE